MRSRSASLTRPLQEYCRAANTTRIDPRPAASPRCGNDSFEASRIVGEAVEQPSHDKSDTALRHRTLRGADIHCDAKSCNQGSECFGTPYPSWRLHRLARQVTVRSVRRRNRPAGGVNAE